MTDYSQIAYIFSEHRFFSPASYYLSVLFANFGIPLRYFFFPENKELVSEKCNAGKRILPLTLLVRYLHARLHLRWGFKFKKQKFLFFNRTL